MSTTVLEALMNAQINFQTLGRMGASNNPFFMIAMEQLDNAITAIDNGCDLDHVIQESMGAEVNLERKQGL